MAPAAGNRYLRTSGAMEYQFIIKTPSDAKSWSYRALNTPPPTKIILRNTWSHAFWIFWNTAKTIHQSIRVLLVHMGEKWTYAIVTRKNNKEVPFLQVSNVLHEQQRNKHAYTEMVIASSAYLTFRNDMTAGGEAFKLSLERVGAKLPAAKDSHKRVTHPYGSHGYPAIPENLLRRKGVLYFKNLELTGSSNGTAQSPKYSLLSFFKDKEIPKLDELCNQLEEQLGCRVIVRYQLDGAGPHNDAKLNQYINHEFDRRGWLFRKQPPNSSLTNVNDTWLFPAFSKKIIEQQGVNFGSRILEPEQLWLCFQNAWSNVTTESTAKAYLHHHQMVKAIAKGKGSNEYAKQSARLHCGVRSHCQPFYMPGANTPYGITVIEEHELPVEKQRKYKEPYTENLVRTTELGKYLSTKELQFFEEHLPENSYMWERCARALAYEGYMQNNETTINDNTRITMVDNNNDTDSEIEWYAGDENDEIGVNFVEIRTGVDTCTFEYQEQQIQISFILELSLHRS